MEWITVWAFSAAWLVKGLALFADSFEEAQAVSDYTMFS
jgi:hypothetical protein